eukprot:4422825-Lingulodinium_polyedra.AAC.1
MRVDDPIFLQGLASLPRQPNPMQAWARIPAMDVYKWEASEVQSTDTDRRQWQMSSKRSIAAEDAEEVEKGMEGNLAEQAALADAPASSTAPSRAKGLGRGKSRAKAKVKAELTGQEARVAELKRDLEALDRAMSMEIKGTLKLLATGQSASRQGDRAWLGPLVDKVRDSLAELNSSQGQVRDVIATTRDPDELQKVVADQKQCLEMFRNGFKKDLQKLLA